MPALVEALAGLKGLNIWGHRGQTTGVSLPMLFEALETNRSLSSLLVARPPWREQGRCRAGRMWTQTTPQ